MKQSSGDISIGIVELSYTKQEYNDMRLMYYYGVKTMEQVELLIEQNFLQLQDKCKRLARINRRSNSEDYLLAYGCKKK